MADNFRSRHSELRNVAELSCCGSLVEPTRIVAILFLAQEDGLSNVYQDSELRTVAEIACGDLLAEDLCNDLEEQRDEEPRRTLARQRAEKRCRIRLR